ncbi:PDR/VanB family oxidoreductase [Alteromonas confluentis]|uniref:Uncharacterized protein n=1 Tax=Alteromonas confluentis TaxID=1656094 RepID=A0A1E7ZG78_9ALTE|nr:PDR/VanB family oxidoreductase [Alteromonas confluentis]OFC72442.1 hypothetical protein BFC18_02435 [Alteromonas confluentis]
MIQVIITHKAAMTPRVCLLMLSAADGSALPAWTPGAHIDLFLANDMIRQYSLCGKLGEDTYQVAVQLEADGKGGSKFIHEVLQEGAELTISEPRNHFPLAEGNSPSVFFAAGIGITPFLPMIEQCQAQDRDFILHYAVARAEDSLLSDEYAALKNVILHDKAIKQERLNIAQALAAVPPEAHVYICGPGSFINDVVALAADAGIAGNRLHREFFSAEPIDHSNDGSFEVEIASTGQVIQIGENDTILNALEDEGLFIPVSCEEGVCGTCVTRLLGGEADHKDVFLTDEEKAQMDQIAVCCSRAKSPRLILGL